MKTQSQYLECQFLTGLTVYKGASTYTLLGGQITVLLIGFLIALFVPGQNEN